MIEFEFLNAENGRITVYTENGDLVADNISVIQAHDPAFLRSCEKQMEESDNLEYEGVYIDAVLKTKGGSYKVFGHEGDHDYTFEVANNGLPMMISTIISEIPESEIYEAREEARKEDFWYAEDLRRYNAAYESSRY